MMCGADEVRQPQQPIVARRTQPGSVESPPTHVAIIMDGNGRWAAARHLPKIAGHREGARAVRRTIEAAIAQNVKWLTIYAAFVQYAWNPDTRRFRNFMNFDRTWSSYERKIVNFNLNLRHAKRQGSI